MIREYQQWLNEQDYAANTIGSQLARVSRVEDYYGDLDDHFARDGLEGLSGLLRYSTEDARRNRPNPTKIPIDGDLRTNLASYRNAVELYRIFRTSGARSARAAKAGEPSEPVGKSGQRLSLERRMIAGLRLAADQLESGLEVIDDGVRRSVASGFIDITARDESGATVVIKFKTGVAGPRAIGEILSYMGDVAAEEENAPVRGILVASDFDAKARSAARVIPGLTLRRYTLRFAFENESDPTAAATRDA